MKNNVRVDRNLAAYKNVSVLVILPASEYLYYPLYKLLQNNLMH